MRLTGREVLIVISLYLGAAIKQNRQTKSVFSLTKHMRDIRQVIRKAKASHWGRWRATGESTTSGARHGLPDYEPYVKHFAESKRKNGRGCKILLNKAPVQGDYFLEFESVETCPIHFFALIKKVVSFTLLFSIFTTSIHTRVSD